MIYATASIFLLAGCDVSDNGSHARSQSMSKDQRINNMQYEFSDHCGIKIFDIKKDIFNSGNNKIRDVRIMDEDCNIEITYFKDDTKEKMKKILSLKDFTALMAESEEKKQAIASSDSTDQKAESSNNILSGLLIGYLLSSSMQQSRMMGSLHQKFSSSPKRRRNTVSMVPYIATSGRAATGYSSNVKTSVLNKSGRGFSVGKPVSLTRTSAFSSSSSGGRASSYGG